VASDIGWNRALTWCSAASLTAAETPEWYSGLTGQAFEQRRFAKVTRPVTSWREAFGWWRLGPTWGAVRLGDRSNYAASLAEG